MHECLRLSPNVMYEVCVPMDHCAGSAADARAEAVDRFGADPDGALEFQARLSRDKTSMTLGVLVASTEFG